jgi:hypothetical protein
MVKQAQPSCTSVAPALEALLKSVFDYAGLFPPAGLPMQQVADNFSQYRSGSFSWMLRRLVVREADLDKVASELDPHLAVLSEQDCKRGSAIESARPFVAGKPVYCEVPTGQLEQLELVQQTGCFAKIRTGGLKPEAIPSCGDVAMFILACADRKLPFKATAGLHHPIRASHPLTYEAGAPQAVMHGFLNVLLAAAFAWHGERNIEGILAETDSMAFDFTAQARWRDKSLSCDQVSEARLHFIHSIGSCSFDEPVNELQGLGLL